MKLWKIFDPGFWVLVGINVWLVVQYYRQPQIFTTLLWLYWCQSVLIGLFTFLDLLTIKNIARPVTFADGLERAGAFVFLFHYGFFHAVYFYFIATRFQSGPLDWVFFRHFFLAFLLGQVIVFVQHKVQQRTARADLGAIFFTPYARILPMHATLIMPAVMHLSSMGMFLVFKTVTDAGMYLVTQPGRNRDLDAEMMINR